MGHLPLGIVTVKIVDRLPLGIVTVKIVDRLPLGIVTVEIADHLPFAHAKGIGFFIFTLSSVIRVNAFLTESHPGHARSKCLTELEVVRVLHGSKPKYVECGAAPPEVLNDAQFSLDRG